MTEYTNALPGGSTDVLEELRRLAPDLLWIAPPVTPAPEKLDPHGLRPHQERLLERMRDMDFLPFIGHSELLVTESAPTPALDLDDALLSYCLGDLHLTERMALMELADVISYTDGSAPAAHSYPVSNLPDVLHSHPDPFRLQKTNRKAKPDASARRFAI